MANKDRERERLERARKAREDLHSKRIRRRLAILGLGAVGGAVVVYVGARIVEQTGMVPPSDSQVILGAAEKIGVRPSIQEQNLWRGVYETPRFSTPVDSRNFPIIQQRWTDVRDRMAKSENPIYREAVESVWRLSKSGDLRLVMLDTVNIHGSGEGLAAGFVVEEDRMVMQMFLSREYILNQSSGLRLANTVSHEVKHLRQMQNQWQKTAGLPVTQRTADMQATKMTVAHEAEAYATEAEAYIRQAGLLGRVYDEQESGQEDRAAKYIFLGMNPQALEWVNYIGGIAPGVR